MLAPAAFAGNLEFDLAGIRCGLGANSSSRDFVQTEVVAGWKWGAPWELGKQMRIQPRLDLSVGWVGEGSRNAALLTGGPALTLERRGFPLSVEAGVSPSFLTRSHFETKDVGSPFQFSNYMGLNGELSRSLRISYRFLHMSNGGVASPNPGLNMHLLGISYVF